jgi:hypothetical protein
VPDDWMRLRLLLPGALWLAGSAAQAQAPAADSARRPTQDLGDLVRRVLPPRLPRPAADSGRVRPPRAVSVVVLPAVGYTLEARLLASVTASVTFRRPAANVSVFSNTLTYTQNRQLVLSVNGTVWRPGNRSLWLSDHRLLHYPQLTYGLGTGTRTANAVAMDYNLLRIHQSYYRRVGPAGALYAGVGYFLDTRWNITSVGPEGKPVAEIAGYRRGVTGRSTSSGLVASVLRDTRANQLRPAAGESYFILAMRANMRALASDATYGGVQFDARRYLRAGRSGNLLALWLYGDFVASSAPYLDLPATGWDTHSVTGRGYIQGRFRGPGLLYGEAEYRFNLTRSRVLGGVVFANGQTVRAPDTGFQRVAPGGGTGLRLCLSKKVGTFLAVDYAWGVQGSRGVFFNLGDVF